MRTNINIDEQLIAVVMQRYKVTSKRAAVDLALRTLVGEPLTASEALSLQGTGWEGDLDAMRASRVSDL